MLFKKQRHSEENDKTADEIVQTSLGAGSQKTHQGFADQAEKGQKRKGRRHTATGKKNDVRQAGELAGAD